MRRHFIWKKTRKVVINIADTTLLNIGREGSLNPIQADELRRQLQSEGISFSESAGPNGTRITASLTGGASSATDLAEQMYGLLTKFKAPAIATLESGRGQIGEMFGAQRQAVEAEKEPLEQRYQSLLKDITGYTTKATSQEFGRRGIPLSSGLYESTLAEKIEPQVRGIGLERESGLRSLQNLLMNLGVSEGQMGLDLNSAIASIQASTGSESIQDALNLYQSQQQAEQQALALALQKWQTESQLGWEKEQWQTEQPVNQAYLEALIASMGGKTSTAVNPYKATVSGGSSFSDLWKGVG